MATILASLAPTGTTGNLTGNLAGVGAAADKVAIQFVVEAVGGSPTVTWKAQGTLDGGASWYDVFYFTDGTDTASKSAITTTGTGAQVIFLDDANGSRFYLGYRIVVSSNTAVTFRAELYYQQKRG